MTSINPTSPPILTNTLTTTSNSLPTPPTVQQQNWNILIPRNIPGRFYYPPCKCELVNQIRYFNPRSREFYYHTAYTFKPDDQTGVTQSPETLENIDIPPTNILGGEPEFYSSNQQPAPSIYFDPYLNHYVVSQITLFLIVGILSITHVRCEL